MTATILDGRRLARDVHKELVSLAARHRVTTGSAARLAILRVGSDPASAVYSSRLLRVAASIGADATLVTLRDDVSDAGLRASIETLNGDESVQGILMQLPLPPRLSQRVVAEAISPRKDVDGISLRSAGNLFLRLPSFVPSTAAAVVEILDRAQIPLAGRRAVVVGASNVVGKPLSFMLLHRDATVTICHIHTRDLAAWTRQADVLVVAAGKPGLIDAPMVKPGATVIDVGINVREDGSIVGDVAFDRVAEVAGAITPVPGGVGPLTNLMLLKQMLHAGEIWSEDE